VALVEQGPDLGAFLAGFQAVAYAAIATVAAFLVINFIRKIFGI